MKEARNAIAIGFEKLGTLVGAGVPLLRALRTIEQETENEVLRDGISSIGRGLEGGESLKAAMARPAGLFSPSILAMIEAAETQGTLGKVLLEIARRIESGTLEVNLPQVVPALGTPKDAAEHDREPAPVVKLLNMILLQAVQDGASDVHFDLGDPDHVRVRYRIDGVLRENAPVPGELRHALLNRIKIISSLNASDYMRPQDGRFGLVMGGRAIDIRVHIAPCARGASVVLRVMDSAQLPRSIEQLEFSTAQLDILKSWFRKPGMIVVTGPAGSGKTTTLYGMLRELNKPEVKIVTVEDPVANVIGGICQMTVNPAIGLTFAIAMRTQLRQAPNIIMAGVIPDIETAGLAVEAALTGHLVLTALHTMDATSALQRMLDMGIPPFQINSAVTGVVAQRLVRRICPDCREAWTPPAWMLESLQDGRDTKFFRGQGCEACGKSGYRGRVALYEFLPITDSIRYALARDESSELLRQAVAEANRPTLREEALAKADAGVVPIEDVLLLTP